jgi:hypothetical protein
MRVFLERRRCVVSRLFDRIRQASAQVLDSAQDQFRLHF